MYRNYKKNKQQNEVSMIIELRAFYFLIVISLILLIKIIVEFLKLF